MAHVMEKVRLCESIIGYEFIQKRHCVDALFAYSGYCHELGPVVLIKKNDGLAVLGDIVLQLRLCKKWLDLGLSRGQWNTVRQEVASNGNLASVGRELGLNACVVVNPGATGVQNSVMATTVEAIIGAVSLDGGDDAVERLMDNLGLIHDLLEAVPAAKELSRSRRNKPRPIQVHQEPAQ